MFGKQLIVLVVVAALSLSFAGASPTQAQIPANDAAHLCQESARVGVLVQLGINVGTCVNLLKGPASEQANNLISAACGIPEVQAGLGTSNRGQCIQVLR